MKRLISFSFLLVLLAGFTEPGTTTPTLNDMAASLSKDAAFTRFAKTNLQLLKQVHRILKEKKDVLPEISNATPERKKELTRQIVDVAGIEETVMRNAIKQMSVTLNRYPISPKEKNTLLKLALTRFYEGNSGISQLGGSTQGGCISGYVDIVVSYSLEWAECINFGISPDRCNGILYEWLVAEFTWLEMENPGCLQLLLNNV